MGKRISVILIVVLAAAAVTFGVLWQSALRDHSDIKALAQAGANEVCSRFSDFQKRGDDGDYWGGVAAFHTFQQAHILLTEGTPQAADRVFCSEVYGALLLKPELFFYKFSPNAPYVIAAALVAVMVLSMACTFGYYLLKKE